ncbi:uncharacterized protein G2W53_038173 [Senna tora]|uniref:Uncharacterized protein n=1 Tax=Senna tora TaxID=362788 RepID=A0A834SRE6_9FABA|nr:uncharacterized protein G2W53_038173 [Senna tora]
MLRQNLTRRVPSPIRQRFPSLSPVTLVILTRMSIASGVHEIITAAGSAPCAVEASPEAVTRLLSSGLVEHYDGVAVGQCHVHPHHTGAVKEELPLPQLASGVSYGCTITESGLGESRFTSSHALEMEQSTWLKFSLLSSYVMHIKSLVIPTIISRVRASKDEMSKKK